MKSNSWNILPVLKINADLKQLGYAEVDKVLYSLKNGSIFIC